MKKTLYNLPKSVTIVLLIPVWTCSNSDLNLPSQPSSSISIMLCTSLSCSSWKCKKNPMQYQFIQSGLKMEKQCNMELLGSGERARRAITLHPFSTSAEQSEAPMQKGCNFITPQALIQQLYYQYFILLLNYRVIFDTSTK